MVKSKDSSGCSSQTDFFKRLRTSATWPWGSLSHIRNERTKVSSVLVSKIPASAFAGQAENLLCTFKSVDNRLSLVGLSPPP